MIFKLFIAVLVLLLANPGISLAQNNIYRALQAPFYDPSVQECSQTDTGTAKSIPAEILMAINKLKPEYIKASQASNVPWQILAAVHYRENNNNPNGDLQAGNPIGGPYTRYSTAYATYGYPKSMAESAEIAGKMLTAISKSGGVVNQPIDTANPLPEAVKDTLFSYNGRAEAYKRQAAQLGFDPEKQPYEGSPYVMNNFDPKHHNMGIITKDFGGLDGTDTRLGAFTLYARLGGLSGDICSDSGAVIGDAVQTAIKYAWADHHEPNYFVMKPEYKTAINRSITKGEYVGGGSHPGIDCGGFVTRVMRDSGADPDYNKYQGPTTAQQRYMDDHPEKYSKLTNVRGTGDLQPGDIAINSSHTYMYVGSQANFKGNSASASYSTTGRSWRSPMADNAYGFAEFSWYRIKQ